jgi:2-polyprenyl-6-methoxyphenol hydroxylase-like FAD-dependent oxidoreductase
MAAAMLGRQGHDAVLIDPHRHYPPDFRCEKLDPSQVRLLRKTGLADSVLRAATLDSQLWIGRFGRVVDRKPNGQPAFLYNDQERLAKAAMHRLETPEQNGTEGGPTDKAGGISSAKIPQNQR